MGSQLQPSRIVLNVNETLCVFVYYGHKYLIENLLGLPSSTGKYKEELSQFRFGFWHDLKIDENAKIDVSWSLPEDEFTFYVYARQLKNKVEMAMEPIKNREADDDRIILGYVSGFVGLPETGIYEYEFDF